MRIENIPCDVLTSFRDGVVIPALPLALDERGALDERHERAILRYYIDAGVGGIAVGVHSTQFEIRDPRHNLFERVLRLASDGIDDWCRRRGRRILKIAGVCGRLKQALGEARFAREAGYHAALLSLAALNGDPIDALLEHAARVAEEIPILGFYLQPAVGGALLPFPFWRRFVEIENVLAIKVAPFNRYQTLDVIRAVGESGNPRGVSLYTGNDDSIVIDLLTPFVVAGPRGPTEVRFAGGLLGHWGVWTRAAVRLLEEIKTARRAGGAIPTELLTQAAAVTDVNAAVFDAANGFRGCIPGIHEMLRRQGLMGGTWCLRSDEVLSPGQADELNRVTAAYPHLSDRGFTEAHRAEWLGD